MKPGTLACTPGMRRMRCFRAEVTGDTPGDLEQRALAEAQRYLPGAPLELSPIYTFHSRHLTIREMRTGEPDPVEGGHALQAQIHVYELVPEDR